MKNMERKMNLGIEVEEIRPIRFAKAFERYKPKLLTAKQQDANEAFKAILEAVAVTSEAMQKSPGREFFSLSTSFPTSASNSNGFFTVHFVLSSKRTECATQSTAFVRSPFEGCLSYTTVCENNICSASSTVGDKMEELVLRLSTGSDKSVAELVGDVIAPEKIAERLCEKCGHRGATRTTAFKRLPDVLQIQVGRFQFHHNQFLSDGVTRDPKCGMSFKLFDHVRITEQLACFCQECVAAGVVVPKHRFDLYSIVTHSGPSLNRGHFTTYVRSAEENCWLHYNDSTRTQPSKEEIESVLDGNSCHNSYLLFFQKMDI